MTKKTISSLKILYSVNMFTLLSREMHIFHNKPQSERESNYLDKHLYNENRERKWDLMK